MRRSVVVLLTLAVISAACWAGFNQPLEGSRWKVNLQPDADAANEKPYADELIFKGGQFIAVETEKRFAVKSAPYEEDTRGVVAASFTVKSTGDNGASATWSGTTTGSEIRGQLQVGRHAGGDLVTFSFTGEKSDH